MGWVVFVKLFEDEYYITYAYSHDSEILDGIIKIKKEFLSYESEDEVFNEFTDDEKDEIFRVIFSESNEEPSVNKEKWRKYSEISNRNNENYNAWYENCITELKLSATDIRYGLFAHKVIHYIADICKKDKNTWKFPERKMLAYG
jgi:hypothetical protein